jgi:serine/threonine protein kinase
VQSERFTKHFASFGREAALLADLNHPNVLRFYGVVTESAADNTVIGIMTEYIRGGSMSSFLRLVPASMHMVVGSMYCLTV